MTEEEEVDKSARYIARLVQGSQCLEGAGLDDAGYAKLIEHARNIVRLKRRERMMELITQWRDDAERMKLAAEQTAVIQRERYPQYYSHLNREQRRDWVRLQNEINEFYAKRDIYNKCADDLAARFTTRA